MDHVKTKSRIYEDYPSLYKNIGIKKFRDFLLKIIANVIFMNFTIDERIYKWLLSLEVIKPEGRKLKGSSPILIELSLSTSLSLESGVLFARLLKALLSKSLSQTNDFPLASLDSLKEFSTPTSRLYNWNILSDAYKLIGLELDFNTKSLIVAGDKNSVLGFLVDLYQKIVIGAAESKENEGFFEDFEELAVNSSNFVGKSFLKKNGIGDSLDLMNVDLEVELNQTQGLLEFFIVCVGRHMALTAKQATSLFAKGSKYLAHVVIKGLKGQYEPIVTYLQEVYSELDHLILLLTCSQNIKTSLFFVLQVHFFLTRL